MIKIRNTVLSMLLFLPCAFQANAQSWNQAYDDYIKKYKDIAIEQMEKFHIPASITLAQGLVESGAGTSTLARYSNNHFGIKCGKSWEGRTVRHDDDARNECFRAYKKTKDSYEDHSKFLRTGLRYAFLFRLDPKDYKGWARGLKRAGYATDPTYANRLIKIIEIYKLYRYDNKGAKYEHQWLLENPHPHQPYLSNDLLYVIARQGDTWKDISKEFDISHKKLIKYNDLYKEYILQPGDIVYLEKKHKHADDDHIIHKVKAGESMYSISQIYGIQLKNLYKMNRMKPDAPAPETGNYIRLR